MGPVKRTYDSSGRRAQAEARRRAVVDAARELFEQQGFRQTTITAVAERAGVSAESIYKGMGSKAALAKAVFDQVIAGDHEPVAVWDRPEVRVIDDVEPDAGRMIELFVSGLVVRIARSARVQLLIRDGRHVDESLEPIWQSLCEEALTGMGLLARRLLDTGRVRGDLTADDVRDLLYNYIAVDHYERLVLDRGWSRERYADWLTRAISAALMP